MKNAFSATPNAFDMSDKTNHVDYCWYIIRTHHRQLDAMVELFEKHKVETRNILEIYVPKCTTVRKYSNGEETYVPKFAGVIFVLATQSALVEFMKEHALDGKMQYKRKQEAGTDTRMFVIPEKQMREFREYNENYADKVLVLERPYSDYAFNTKANEPNELVRVVDGLLAGRVGYICRFRGNRGLVFEVQDAMPGNHLTVVYPNAYDLHVVRLQNADGDRLSVDTEKPRGADLIIGMLQVCGYGDRTQQKFYDIIDTLAARPSLVELCKSLFRQGEQELSTRMAKMTEHEAGLVINLARYEHDIPGYVKEHWPQISLRPFLTPTSGVELQNGQTEAQLQHSSFKEIIRKVNITEELYFPSKKESEMVTTPYYAHIGVISPSGENSFVLFANWDGFLSQYFLTAGKANEKLVEGRFTSANKETKGQGEKEKMIESFRNFAPTLYKVLTDTGSSVKAVKNFKVDGATLNVMTLTATDLAEGIDELVHTCVDICKEINRTNRLAIWRRYLRSVWLHI